MNKILKEIQEALESGDIPKAQSIISDTLSSSYGIQPESGAKRYSIYFEADDDFSIRFNGDVYYGDEYLFFDDISELDCMEVLGAWGSERTEHTKCREWEDGIESIKSNPEEPFTNLGGNRGISFSIEKGCHHGS